MRSDWQQIRLGDILTLKGGLSYKGKYVGAGNAVLIGMGCVSYSERFLVDGCRSYCGTYTDNHLVKPGDLVIATRQQSDNLPILGFPAMIPKFLSNKDIVVGTNLYKVMNSSGISNGFLYWLLRGREFKERILSCRKGTTVRMITKDAIENFQFSCPGKYEREAIAQILDSFDAKIELNRRMTETLEEMARALFKSWFVDFDPVRAKKEGRWKQGESLPGMPAHLWELFPDKLVDSELGEIPEGWRIDQIGNLVQVLGGGTPSTKRPEYWEGGRIHWTTPKDLSNLNSPVLLDTARKITEKGLSAISSGLLPVGTLLISSRAPVGYLAIAQVPVAVNQGYIAIPPNGQLSSLFLLYWADAHMAEIKQRADGTTFAEISKRNFRPIPVVVPSHHILDLFQHIASPLFNHIAMNEINNNTLAALRDTLLPKLISGEIKVNAAE